MSKILTCASGSRGNCTYIGTPNGGILIDVGISAARVVKELCGNGIDPNRLEAIFVTHEHTDHISGIKVFASKYNLPVYMTQGTKNTCENSFDNRVTCHKIENASISAIFP